MLLYIILLASSQSEVMESTGCVHMLIILNSRSRYSLNFHFLFFCVSLPLNMSINKRCEFKNIKEKENYINEPYKKENKFFEQLERIESKSRVLQYIHKNVMSSISLRDESNDACKEL